MTEERITSIDGAVNEFSYDIVHEYNFTEEEIQKCIGVLFSDGVYAFYIYCKSKKDKFNDLYGKCADKFVKYLSDDYLYNRDDNKRNYESFYTGITHNLADMLFFKKIVENVLKFAKYHAKAKTEKKDGDKNG